MAATAREKNKSNLLKHMFVNFTQFSLDLSVLVYKIMEQFACATVVLQWHIFILVFCCCA